MTSSSGGPTDANEQTAQRLEAALDKPERERMVRALDTLIAILGWAIEREAEANKANTPAPSFPGSRMSTR